MSIWKILDIAAAVITITLNRIYNTVPHWHETASKCLQSLHGEFVIVVVASAVDLRLIGRKYGQSGIAV
jgi:hypothetical protein